MLLPKAALIRLALRVAPALCFLAAWAPLRTLADTSPARVIVDTDFESDVDDVAALALMHALALRGEMEILAVGVAGLHDRSGAAIDAVNGYFGRPDIPIGIRRVEGVLKGSSYTSLLIERYPHDFDAASAPEAVALYRKILEGEEDGSVTIVSLGYLTNLAGLMESEPDENSPRSGRELIQSKVRRYICMGGSYPAQTRGGNWGNFLPDPESARKVNDGWPGPILFTGGSPFSDSVPTGRAFIEDFPEDNLLHLAYKRFFENATWAEPPDHHSADLIPIYIAGRGVAPLFVETIKGSNRIAEDGTMEWQYGRDDPDRSYVADLAPGVDGAEVGRGFEQLIWEACEKR